MGWETRRGHRYYYAKERVPGGGVRSIYMGSGPLAEYVADLVEEERALAEAQRRHLASVREEGRTLAVAYDALARYTHLNVSAQLILKGYRTHRRQWRRRRYPLPELMPKKKKVPAGPMPMAVTFDRGDSIVTVVDGDAAEADIDKACDLIRLCDTADPEPSDLRALRRWAARDGVMVKAEELAHAVQLRAVSPYKNAFAEETVLAGVRDLMQRMGYEDADAVERLMIMQIGTAWLVLQSEQKNLERITSGSYSLREAEACDKRVSRAHSRWIRATESLEKIRALRRVTEIKTCKRAPNWNVLPVEDAEFAVVGA